jgi:hypothetical protein
MHIVVNEDLKAYIDPLTPDEHDALERSLLTEGCRDALVLWGDVLVDGHNRYGICQKHGIPFQTLQSTLFKTMDDVHLWMIDQHLGRRSVSDFQRGVLALRKREILNERRLKAEPAVEPDSAPPAAQGGKELPRQAAKRVRESKKRTPAAESPEAMPESVEALKARITQALQHAEVVAVAPVPALDRATGQAQGRKRHHARRVKKILLAQAVAGRAGTHRRVEREQTRLQLLNRVVAHRAGKLRIE